jgi:hypothetical protein
LPKPESFWRRFAAALISSNVVFSPFLLWAAVSALQRSDVQSNLGGWLLSAMVLVAYSEVIIVVAIFVVAYPVERWLVKPDASTASSASIYLLIGIAAIAVSFILTFATISQILQLGWLPAYLFFGSLIGTFTAFFARFIYPRVMRLLTRSKVEQIETT